MAQREGDLMFSVSAGRGFLARGPALAHDRLRVAEFHRLCRRYANQPRCCRRQIFSPTSRRSISGSSSSMHARAGQPGSTESVSCRSQTRTRRSTSTPMCSAVSRRICKAISAPTGGIWCAATTRTPRRPQTDAPLDNAYYGRHVAEVVGVQRRSAASLRVQSDMTQFNDQTKSISNSILPWLRSITRLLRNLLPVCAAVTNARTTR